MSNGNMAVLNRNIALGISGWAHYTTDGYFRAITVSDNDTYVVVERDLEFFLEKFSYDELVDAGSKPYTSLAYGTPIMTSGHNAKYIRITKIIARMNNSKTLFINNMRAVFPTEIYSDDAPAFSGDISMNVLGTLKDTVDSPWEISTNDELPMTVLSITIYGRYQI